MTPESLTELNRKIAVMEAYRDGKEIEEKRHSNCNESDYPWIGDKHPLWNWLHCDYRVKPIEPARLYRSALGGIYCTPTGEVVGEFIELTPSVREKLGL